MLKGLDHKIQVTWIHYSQYQVGTDKLHIPECNMNLQIYAIRRMLIHVLYTVTLTSCHGSLFLYMYYVLHARVYESRDALYVYVYAHAHA